MRKILLLTSILLASCTFWSREPVPNPDPNHTHADFMVWIGGEQLDFSGPEYMSEQESDSAEEDHAEHGHEHHPYLHLHDGNGHVIHRHKPGLTVGEFFTSIGFGPMYDGKEYCWVTRDADTMPSCASGPLRLYVNGNQHTPTNSPFEYVFVDGDQILLTDSTDPAELQTQLNAMTDDACLYSKTCPWRGDPPTENCIADPEVPCVAP